MACAAPDIKRNLAVNCDNPLAKGVGELIYTGRISDIDTVAYDSSKKVITAFVMKTGKKLKKWRGQNFSNQVTVGFTANEYGNSLPQGLRYVLFSNDAADETEVDDIAQINDMFSVVKKNGNPGAYKVYGWKTGLRMSNLTSDSNDDTLKGAIVMEFSAPDEKTMPYTLKHMTTGGSPTDDTDIFLAGLALADA